MDEENIPGEDKRRELGYTEPGSRLAWHAAAPSWGQVMLFMGATAGFTWVTLNSSINLLEAKNETLKGQLEQEQIKESGDYRELLGRYDTLIDELEKDEMSFDKVHARAGK